MQSVDGKHTNGEDSTQPPLQPHLTPQPSQSFAGMPVHVYPIPNQFLQPQQPVRSKRRQVKNACTHCQKACKKCDDARPCLRCVKYGISEECVDSQRKERKKGIKRGPYKKRDGKYRASGTVDPSAVSSHAIPVPPGVGQPLPYMPMPGYPPGFYGHYTPLASKQGEGQSVYPAPQYFLAPIPHPVAPPPQGATEGDPAAYPTQGYYQAAVLAPLSYHPQYAMPRADGSPLVNQYPMYPAQVYKSPDNSEGDVIVGDTGGVEEAEKDVDKTV